MKKHTVAIYSGDIPSTTFIENLVCAVANAGYKVYIFGRRKNNIRYSNSDIHVYSIPTNKFKFGFWLGWYSFVLAVTNPEKHRKLNGLVVSQSRKGKNATLVRAKYLPVFLHTPDIFHVQWARSAEDWAPLGELLGVKLILSFRGAQINSAPIAEPGLAEMYQKVFPLYDAFHAVCEAIATEGRKYLKSEHVVRVIHSGIKNNISGKPSMKEPKLAHNSPLRILSVGRFNWKKGYPIAFEAISKLVAAGVNLKYELVAGGDNEEAVYLAHDMNLQQHVRFHDNMKQSEVFKLMSECDLLLLPSVEEGIANVVLEAMAIGLPVLSSDCGGMAEVVKDGDTGLLFKIRNSEQLASKVMEFMKMNPAQKSEMTETARKHVLDQFSMSRLETEMNRLYHEVLNEKPGQ